VEIYSVFPPTAWPCHFGLSSSRIPRVVAFFGWANDATKTQPSSRKSVNVAKPTTEVGHTLPKSGVKWIERQSHSYLRGKLQGQPFGGKGCPLSFLGTPQD
jgi:hypothetical protein